MSRESVLENMGTGFSSLEPPLEQEYCEDQLIWNTLKRFDG